MSFTRFCDQRDSLREALRQRTDAVEEAARRLRRCLAGGGKILACGNGGSAAQAAHFAGELVGRFRSDRRPLAALSLNSDGTVLTGLANDFGAAESFARQVAALGREGDLLLVFTTSGNSPSVERALRVAHAGGLATLALLGGDGGRCRGLAELEIIAPGATTDQIQESHLVLLHYFAESLEDFAFSDDA